MHSIGSVLDAENETSCFQVLFLKANISESNLTRVDIFIKGGGYSFEVFHFREYYENSEDSPYQAERISLDNIWILNHDHGLFKSSDSITI